MPSRKDRPITEYRNYYLSAEFPLLVLTGEDWIISDTINPNMHFHNCLEIGICNSHSGVMQFYSGNVSVEFHSGDVTCIPRNILHNTWSTSGTKSNWSYLFLDAGPLFEGKKIPFSSSSLVREDASTFLFRPDEYPILAPLVRAVVAEYTRPDSSRELLLAYTYALYLEILRIQQDRPGKYYAPLGDFSQVNESETRTALQAIIPALNYIDDNYMNHFSMEYLADLCHLSPTHFRRLFQSVIRTSPITYLNITRIMKACGLLKHTNYTILSIAEMTGFSTLSNFNRQFQHIMNTTPREYRKTATNSNEDIRPTVVEYTGWMEPNPGGEPSL